MQFTVSPEMPKHSSAVHDLIEAAFGPNRTSRTVYQFRDQVPPVDGLRYVASSAELHLIGSISFWPALLPDGKQTVLLGPLAVLPQLRGQGVGRTLVSYGLERVRMLGYDACLIVGDPVYYRSFGFSAEVVDALSLPGPVAPLTFMGTEFTTDALMSQAGEVTPFRTHR